MGIYGDLVRVSWGYISSKRIAKLVQHNYGLWGYDSSSSGETQAIYNFGLAHFVGKIINGYYIYIYGLVKVYQTFQVCKFSVIISKNEILSCQHMGESNESS